MSFSLLPLYRYDARLLLDVLPSPSSSPTPAAPASPSGWSDLPSDAEDTFFFAPEEADEYRRAKRRRVFEQDREARLRALREADPEEEEEEAWGGSDEEVSVPSHVVYGSLTPSPLKKKKPARHSPKTAHAPHSHAHPLLAQPRTAGDADIGESRCGSAVCVYARAVEAGVGGGEGGGIGER